MRTLSTIFVFAAVVTCAAPTVKSEQQAKSAQVRHFADVEITPPASPSAMEPPGSLRMTRDRFGGLRSANSGPLPGYDRGRIPGRPYGMLDHDALKERRA